jgi:hypothetical protein
MIFSRIFKAKWQHKDSNIRIEAINDTLDPASVDGQQILSSLLAEDDNELVRRAVLLKINNFALWLSTSVNNNNKKIRHYALQQVENILLGKDTLTLSNDEKLQFIKEHEKSALFDSLLRVEQNEDIIIALYQKLAKPQLLTTLFKTKKNEKVQSFLLEQIDNQDSLQKLLKYSVSDVLKRSIEDKINTLAEASVKPVKVKKQLQLILSKLLAVKDIPSYQDVLQRKKQLSGEWHALQKDLVCLSSHDITLFNEKFSDIESQLSRFFVIKAEAYEQQLIEEKLIADKTAAVQQFDRLINAQAHILTSAIFENSDINDTAFLSELENISAQLKASVLTSNQQLSFSAEIDRLTQQLGRLPEIAQSVTDATHLVSKIAQIPLPSKASDFDERSIMFEEWVEQWSLVYKKAHGVLPESIVTSYEQVVTQWRKALKPLKRQHAQQLTWLRKKVADVQRLIEAGKYNAAFGVFNKAEKSYQTLSVEQQAKISHDFQLIKDKMAELSDWEHYIATPRKQKLLEQVNSLVLSPLDNPNEQAAQVKLFRKTWNSLGHAEEDVDKSMNIEFNLACEQAFAPCRLYFAEQEKLRKNNLQVREAIVSDAKNLADKYQSDIDDFKLIDAKINALQQRWHDAGEVDRDKYKALSNIFSRSLKPLKLKISQQQQANSEQKQNLIVKAAHLSELEDINQATDQIKKLQQQWKLIGFAGKQAENSLWQKFRAINDDLFAKKKALHLSEKEEHSKRSKELNKQLDGLTQQLSLCKDSLSLNTLNEEVDRLKLMVEQENLNERSLFNKINSLHESIDTARSNLRKQAQHQHWINLFSCFELMLTPSIDVQQSAEFSQLHAQWKKQIIESLSLKSTGDRTSKTLALEITAGIDSPLALKSQRMAVQVVMMKEQMSSGTRSSVEQLLIEWLALGPISDKDSDFIRRLKPIFIKQ